LHSGVRTPPSLSFDINSQQVTSDMDIERAQGGEFLLLVEPWFL
jgi:hypothetical protein